MTIDSHQHFWKYNPHTHAWINEEMRVLKKDFLPNDLKQIYKQNNVDSCVAVQASQTEAETEFLHKLSIDHEFIRGVVGWVDLMSKKIDERLEYYSNFTKIVGFRHILQDEPDPNFMLESSFLEGISKLEAFGFTYDILVYPTQLDSTLKFVSHFPNQKFVIDHIAKPYIQDGKIYDWKKAMKQIAVYENVTCKLSGMVTEANWKTWSPNDFTPYLDVVIEAFGSNRLLFGSDWPVCLLASSYTDMKNIITQFISKLNVSEQKNIMGLNAIDFYNLKA